MHRISILPTALLLACGPVTPPVEVDSTTGAPTATAPVITSGSTDSTTPGMIPTTTDPAPDTGTEFITRPDSFIGTENCDNWAQNCAEGQKCVAWAENGGSSWNATKCVDIMGDNPPGAPCQTFGGDLSGEDNCAFGAMCWEVGADHHGTCVALCTGTHDAPVCPVLHRCAIAGEGTLNLCLPVCDPLVQDCPGGEQCIPSGDDFVCVPDGSGDEGQANDPCEFPNSCDKGLACIDTPVASAACNQGSLGCCQPFCNFPDAPCPNPDQQCLQWFDPMMQIPEEYEHVGVCAIPK